MRDRLENADPAVSAEDNFELLRTADEGEVLTVRLMYYS